ncbi:MAG: mycofactocin system FadH/OYE family oxidoreductase 2 [Actinobacteria bacterium]|nr:mycofactocin system FadH/OYE family oxidoreductase 2 [Actinomycetota bacterium]
MTAYRYLFSPLSLGPIDLENRIVFAAHLTSYAADGLPTPQHAAYYEERARSGVGLIITEEHSTHPSDWPYEKLIHGFNPAVLDGYRLITDTVHRHGVPILAQINHNGGQASGMYSRLPVWAPSPVADPLFREVPMAVGEKEISEIITGYADVAARCIAGGFDGIELQCSHSSIVRQFLSPITNLRADEYGGVLENRVRILRDIVAAVRDAIGRDSVLGVRLCGDELLDDGIRLDEAVAVARILEADGLIDYINTSIGSATSTLFMIEASMHVPPGYSMYIPAAISTAVDLPVIGVGRFKDPLQADRALVDGHCDAVGIVRGQIADAEFVAKAKSGHTEEITLCLSCNQECVGRVGMNRWLGCVESPRTGREAEPATPRPQRSKRVLVVGAGPAGLQTAATAAARGHDVTVLERADEVGGSIRLAASVPNRAEIGDLIRNQVAACQRAGVTIRTGVTVDIAIVEQMQPDEIVIATGSEPADPLWVPEEHAVGVAHIVEVLAGTKDVTGRVVVVDDRGFHGATSVAELLAAHGCEVTIITAMMVVGQDLGITLDLENWNRRAAAAGIAQRTDLVVMGLTDDGVTALHHPSDSELTIPCDWVVLDVAPRPTDGLYREMVAAGWQPYRVGDCLAPRRAHAAVIDGTRVGSLL